MSEAIDLAVQSIRRHEGQVVNEHGWHVAYDDDDGGRIDWTGCCKGHPTIGFGHNLRRGISEDMAWRLLREDVATAAAECVALMDKPTPVMRFLTAVRQAVLIELCFAMDAPKLKGFVLMIEAVRIHDYGVAASELLDSPWARRVGDQPGQRAWVLSERLRTGA